MLLPYLEGENQDYDNYQPISLISNRSKLMEKIVHPRLYSFLEKNPFFFERQYGFRNKLSTNHAPVDTTSAIQTACDKVSLLVVYMLTSKKPLILLIISFYLKK